MLNHVCLHQTVIGQETIAQMEMAGEEPDVVIGCVGGGSNFAGLAFPWLRRTLRDGAKTRYIAAEPAACPTLTRGAYRYDFGDTMGMTPLMPMYTLGHDFVPPPVHAGGLRYHGDSPMVCGLVHAGLIEPRAYHQSVAFDSAIRFARTEGIVPGPEPAHAIAAVIEEATPPRRPATSASSCSACPATGTSTWAPTRRSWPGSSRTSSSARPTWRPPWHGYPTRPQSRSR